MFVTEEDYRVVVGDSALRVISQASAENRANAELEAMEEIAGYLRPKYDTQAIFQAEGDARNRLIVMYTADIALYHLVSAMPQRMGSEVRQERYERAISWLEGVAKGSIVPDLPTAQSDGEEQAGTFLLQSEPPLRHNW